MKNILFILICLFFFQASAVENLDSIMYEENVIIIDLIDTKLFERRHSYWNLCPLRTTTPNEYKYKEDYTYLFHGGELTLMVDCGANRPNHNFVGNHYLKKDTVESLVNDCTVITITSQNDSTYFRTDFYKSFGGIQIIGLSRIYGQEKLNAIMNGIRIKNNPTKKN